MKKPGLVASIMILFVLSAAATFKVLDPVPTAARQVVTTPRHTAAALPSTTYIMPASVVDSRAEFFIGTGDGSAGSWVRP